MRCKLYFKYIVIYTYVYVYIHIYTYIYIYIYIYIYTLITSSVEGGKTREGLEAFNTIVLKALVYPIGMCTNEYNKWKIENIVFNTVTLQYNFDP
jgi:hypothetical protein